MGWDGWVAGGDKPGDTGVRPWLDPPSHPRPQTPACTHTLCTGRALARGAPRWGLAVRGGHPVPYTAHARAHPPAHPGGARCAACAAVGQLAMWLPGRTRAAAYIQAPCTANVLGAVACVKGVRGLSKLLRRASACYSAHEHKTQPFRQTATSNTLTDTHTTPVAMAAAQSLSTACQASPLSPPFPPSCQDVPACSGALTDTCVHA